MKNANIANTIFLIAILALMQIATFAQKAELVVQTGHTFSVDSVVYSPDGKIIASGGSDNAIILWDAHTGQEIRKFNWSNTPIWSVIFSPDGNILAACSNNNKSVKLWDLTTGQELPSLNGHASDVMTIAFSPDGKILASGSRDKTIKFWDIRSGKEIRTLSGHHFEVFSIAFSPDNKLLASAALLEEGTVKLWDVQSGKEIRTLTRPDSGTDLPKISVDISSLAFSPKGDTLASGNEDTTVKLWDVNTGKLIRTLSGHRYGVYSVAFSPDGKIIASGGLDQVIKLWDVQSGKEVRTLIGHYWTVASIAFSPNGKTLVSASPNSLIIVWDIQTGLRLQTLERHADYIRSVDFSSDGKTIVTGGWGRAIKLWDIQKGKLLHTLEGDEGWVNKVAFSSDGKTLATESYPNINLWDVETGGISKSFQIDNPKTQSEVIAFVPNFYEKDYKYSYSRDRKFKVEIGENGSLNLFGEFGKLLVSLIAIDENDWAVIDPDGRFDASSGAQKLMHFVVGLEPIDLEQIKDRYYTPNLLQRIFKGENLDATRKVSVFTADELYPLAEYAPLKANETVVNVKLKNRGGGIGRVQVYVNGAEFLADARPKGFDPKSKSAELKIDFSAAKTLKKGEPNSIKIIARNEADWLRNRGTEIVYLDERKKDETPQDFYAIIGGVSDYENKDFNLRYSAKDARDFARATELGAVKLFGKDRVHIRLLASGAESDAAILTGVDSKQLAPTKENFKKTFEEFRKAKPTDVFVVYLAGHGTSINRGGDTGDTYLYLTQEAVTTDKSRLLDDKLRDATTISSEELAEWIRDVPALKRAMILDTCAAGAVEASLIKPRDLSPDQIKALDRMKDRTGFYVLMGSAADAQSYEATRYGQGLLTYSLLQGMSGAKLRGGEYADVSALFDYATDRVTEMAKGIGGIQQPRIIAPTESRPFDIGRFSGEEKSKFTLAKVKPLILQPQLSNDKLKFDNLKLSQMVAKALRDESSTVSRGDAEAKLVFVEAEEMQDAVTPGGVYEISGDQIKVTLILIRNNEPFKTVTVEGSAADREELSRKIVRTIIENAPH